MDLIHVLSVSSEKIAGVAQVDIATCGYPGGKVLSVWVSVSAPAVKRARQHPTHQGAWLILLCVLRAPLGGAQPAQSHGSMSGCLQGEENARQQN